MKILALETATDICGVSLINDGNVVDIVEEKTPRKHAEVLPLFVDRLFKKTKFGIRNIDAVALSIGPGSFTGLRIVLSYAKGLAYSRNLPLIPVPTMVSLSLSGSEKISSKMNILLYSHGKSVFHQVIHSDKSYDRPVSKIWDDLIFDETEVWLHYGCGKLLKEENSIREIIPSSRNIGVLANKYSDIWMVDDPKQLVPDYISPFKVNKKKK